MSDDEARAKGEKLYANLMVEVMAQVELIIAETWATDGAMDGDRELSEVEREMVDAGAHAGASAMFAACYHRGWLRLGTDAA
jgi:hypothetical protein